MKKIIYILLANIILLALVGCSKKEAKSEGPVTINFYSWIEPETIEKLITTFNESQNEVIVKYTSIPATEYEVKLLSLLTAREDVDVFGIKTQILQFPYLESGLLADLGEIDAAKDFDFSKYDRFKNYIQIKGKYYGLPYRGAGEYIYFNKKIFDRVGEKYPEEYVKNNEWTWQKYYEVAKRIHDKDPNVYGAYQHFWPVYGSLQSSQLEAKLVDDNNNIVVDKYRGAILKDFHLRKTMEANGSIWPYKELKTSKVNYQSAFVSGKVAMTVIGEWFPASLHVANEKNLFDGDFTWNDWGATRIPSDDSSKYKINSMPTMVYIPSFTQKKDEAFKFMSWYTGAEGGQELADIGIMPSIVPEKAKEILKARFPDEISWTRYFENVDSYAITFSALPLDGIYSEALDYYFTSDNPVSDDELIDFFKTKLKQAISEAQ